MRMRSKGPGTARAPAPQSQPPPAGQHSGAPRPLLLTRHHVVGIWEAAAGVSQVLGKVSRVAGGRRGRGSRLRRAGAPRGAASSGQAGRGRTQDQPGVCTACPHPVQACPTLGATTGVEAESPEAWAKPSPLSRPLRAGDEGAELMQAPGRGIKLLHQGHRGGAVTNWGCMSQLHMAGMATYARSGPRNSPRHPPVLLVTHKPPVLVENGQPEGCGSCRARRAGPGSCRRCRRPRPCCGRRRGRGGQRLRARCSRRRSSRRLDGG